MKKEREARGGKGRKIRRRQRLNIDYQARFQNIPGKSSRGKGESGGRVSIDPDPEGRGGVGKKGRGEGG